MRFLIALALVLTSACSVARPVAGATGEEIYQQLCVNCHGDDLEGGSGPLFSVAPPIGQGSNAAEQPEEFLEITILHGRGRMPSFSSSLNEVQLQRLIKYMRDVQDG